MKQWKTPSAAERDAGEMTGEFGDFFGRLFANRGLFTKEAAESFFDSGKMEDPFAMADMEKAVEVINAALETGKRIRIIGDYDCDGVTAAAILYDYFESQGADVSYYLPRRIEDGYGMNIPTLERAAADGVGLIITVDNGISAIKEAEFLKEKGIDLVVTDHHEPGTRLPECAACIDPKRADDHSAFKELCGAGVALKLLIALEGDEEFILDTYSDFACLGTVADVVPLTGENRFIVKSGLINIFNEQHPGVTELIRAASRDPAKVTASDIAFYIAPRINSAGRVSSAEQALGLLLDTDPESARAHAQELCALNDRRKSMEDAILKDIAAKTAADPLILKQRVIVLVGNGWHPGVIGLAAGKLTEKYGKPSVVVTVMDGGEARGSVRSIEGFSVFDMLSGCSEGEFFTSAGGHLKAGGFSLPADRTEELKKRIFSYALERFAEMPADVISADMEVTPDVLTLQNVERLSVFEPCGEGNKAPKFLIRGCRMVSKEALKGGSFTKFQIACENGSDTVEAVTFRIPFDRFHCEPNDRIDIIVSAEINEFRGERKVQLRLEDYRPAGFDQNRFLAAQRTYEALCRGESCEKRLEPRVIPQSREELMRIYDLVKQRGGRMTPEELAVFGGTVNYCMLKVTLDAFEQAGMIKYNGIGAPITVPVTGKRDILNGGLLAELKKQFNK